jgi:hypothetical protein
MLLARLDEKNTGKIDVTVFVKDMSAHIRAEAVWAKVSDAVGAAGGAQLAAFVGDGTALATPALLAALRQLGIDLTDDDYSIILRDIDPRGTQYAKIEAVVLLVHHRLQ